MMRGTQRSKPIKWSAASEVYKRQPTGGCRRREALSGVTVQAGIMGGWMIRTSRNTIMSRMWIISPGQRFFCPPGCGSRSED